MLLLYVIPNLILNDINKNITCLNRYFKLYILLLQSRILVVFITI